MGGFLRIVVLGTVAVLAASYGGAVHPLGDSLAVFRLWISAVLVVVSGMLMWFGGRRIGALGLGAAVGAAVWIAPLFVARNVPEAEAQVVVYSKNTWGGRGDDRAIVADILRVGADVVLLQEVSATRSDFAGALAPELGHVQMCQFSDWSGIGIVSRWPISERYCSPHRSFAAAMIEAPSGAFWAVSTHLVWPFPHAQWPFLEAALPFLEQISGPAIVGGDFNMVPWGASVRRVAQATGTSLIGPVRRTLTVRGVPLQIDHILSDAQGRVDIRPKFGTDHSGIVARLSWAAK